MGHIARNCKPLTPIEKGSTTRYKEQRKAWKRIEYVKEKCSISLCAIEKKNLWHVDSGGSKHMTGDPSKFISLKLDQKEKVTFGDNLSSKITRKGTMALRNKVKEKNVLLVELKPNILSVSQTCDQGRIFIFYSKKCEIRKKNSGKLIGTIVKTSRNVYILENEEQCYMSQIDESMLWHRSMGHLNFENIVKISKKGVIRNLPKIIKPPNYVCRQCLHGKQTKASFNIKENTTSQPLQIIHTDICGPTRTKIMQGDHYFMLFIGDHTRMTWVEFLKEK